MTETVVVASIIGVIIAISVPATDSYRVKQRLNHSAGAVEAAFSLARGEAGRTGDVHLVFVAADTLGAALTYKGNTVDVSVVNDGVPGQLLQNCRIDTGETVAGYTFESDTALGNTGSSGVKASTDGGGGSMASGSTFTQPGGGAATWVMFRPDGTPLTFASNCATGPTASGGGAIYLTNGANDTAVVLTPLGASRQYNWSGSAWQD